MSREMTVAQQLAKLAEMRVFFGHQSVGGNVMEGLKGLARAEAASINFRHGIGGPFDGSAMFVDAEIGRNCDPESKLRAFSEAVGKMFGDHEGVALFKYCYVDFDEQTDAAIVFESHCGEMEQLRARFPAVRFVHVTVPLTFVEPAPKAWLKAKLGRVTLRELNAKRERFNKLLRKQYSDSLFDLAGVEATNRDGSKATFRYGSERLPMLSAELSEDGGHLNEEGSHRAARELLRALTSC